jgi:2-hydroxychromene-2-carboxylate isomerase
MYALPFTLALSLLLFSPRPLVCSPVHPNRIPFLRALTAFEVASTGGLAVEFVEAYGKYQWGEGLSAGTDYGLQLMMREASMSPEQIAIVFERIRTESPEESFASWETKTAPNRSYLLSRGLWGVPCVKYNDVILFGQDKLWAIERMIAVDASVERGETITKEDEAIYQSILKYAGT